MKRLLLSCLLFLIPAASYAGPFGLEMGMSHADISKIVNLEVKASALYTASELPKKHPDFNRYILVITPPHGLCKIVAMGNTITTSVYGTELLSKFDTLEQSLSAKYGTSTRYDYLKSGSIWSEPRDWLMSLRKNERMLASSWDNKTKELPDNLSYIEIGASVLGVQTGVIHLIYQFKNVDKCMEWMSNKENAAL